MSGERLRGQFFVGLDLGQAKDFTAAAVLERAELVGDWDAGLWAYRKNTALRLRHLERLALGTSYPDVVERVKEITHSRELAGRCQLVVDATGVGRPVVDLLRRADLGCRIVPATITGGETESSSEGYHRVPKRDLITGVQVMLQKGDLRIAGGLPNGAELAKEMAEMRVKVTAAGNTQYGAWREGSHDDLVLAVALACWGARKAYPGGPRGQESYWRREDQDDWGRALTGFVGERRERLL